MSVDPEPWAIPLSDVANRCRQETELFYRRLVSDTRYCFELFRRALARRDAGAFDLLFSNYTTLVNGWVRRHPGFRTTGEEADYFVTLAFEKLWTAVTPARFTRFGDLRALLRYLQMCVHSCVVDHLRHVEAASSLDSDEDEGPLREPAALQPELSSAERRELWQAVEMRLQGQKERIVMQACFALSLKPAEVCQHFPEMFESVQEVYRVKQNLLERLRRDGELKRLLRAYA